MKFKKTSVLSTHQMIHFGLVTLLFKGRKRYYRTPSVKSEVLLTVRLQYLS
jgi:hypothetical protein